MPISTILMNIIFFFIVPSILIIVYFLTNTNSIFSLYFGDTGKFVGFLTALLTYIYVVLTGFLVRESIKSSQQLILARHTLLRELEIDMDKIQRSKTVQISTNNGSFEPREFRYVLDQPLNWIYVKSDTEHGILSLPKYIDIEGQRHWLVRDKESCKCKEEQYLSSQAFHEVLLWFKRLKIAYNDKVVKNEDLLDLWRQILPFGVGDRLYYFFKYFSGKDEIESLIYIINQTISYCYELKRDAPINYYLNYASDEDRELLKPRNNAKKDYKHIMVTNK
ncbi:MAG: hypothetical protein QJR05_12850 [Thermoanaerobacterium sp.]|nr:hypothetical protein [Thermoanaerobacterium sp.]